MIKDRAGDRSEGDGSVVSWGVTVAFVKDTGNIAPNQSFGSRLVSS